MNPYRTAPTSGPAIEPEVDRLPVRLRPPVLRAGWIIVTPSRLRFEPLIGRARSVPIDAGVDALHLSPVLAAAMPTLETWCVVATSAPYQRPLAHARHGVVATAHAHSFARGVDERRSFALIVDGDRLVAIEAEVAFARCFSLPAELVLPDRSGAMLGRALAWLGPEALVGALDRARAHCRVFTRAQVRDRPSYRVEDRRFELLGTSSRDAIAVEPTVAESLMLGRWAAG